jgi:hypothetical protein
LMREISKSVHMPSDVFNGKITMNDYIITITKRLATELVGRSINLKTIPLVAELALILKEERVI